MGCWSCSSVSPCACGATWSGRSVQVWGRQQVGITRCHLGRYMLFNGQATWWNCISFPAVNKNYHKRDGYGWMPPSLKERAPPSRHSEALVDQQSDSPGFGMQALSPLRLQTFVAERCGGLWGLWGLALLELYSRQAKRGAMKCSSAKIPRFSLISQNTGSSWVTWLTLRLLLLICSRLDRSHMRVRIRLEWACV